MEQQASFPAPLYPSLIDDQVPTLAQVQNASSSSVPPPPPRSRFQQPERISSFPQKIALDCWNFFQQNPFWTTAAIALGTLGGRQTYGYFSRFGWACTTRSMTKSPMFIGLIACLPNIYRSITELSRHTMRKTVILFAGFVSAFGLTFLIKAIIEHGPHLGIVYFPVRVYCSRCDNRMYLNELQ